MKFCACIKYNGKYKNGYYTAHGGAFKCSEMIYATVIYVK